MIARRRRRGILCVALLGSYTAAYGADTVLPSLEVIGTTPLPGIGGTVEDLPANVQRFDARAIDASRHATPAEFLDRNAGSVASGGAAGNPFQMDLSYRGFAASPLLGTPQGLSVFLDGVRVNEMFGDVVNWDLLPLNALAEIALVPGSNPVYGLNTLGGALVLTTRSGTSFPGTTVDITGGSFGRRSVSGQHGGSRQPVDWFVSGNVLEETGWREHSPSRLRQAFAKVRYRAERTAAELAIEAADNSLHGTQALPSSMLDRPRQAYTWPDLTHNELTSTTLRARHALAGAQEITAQSYWRHLRSTSLNSNVSGTVGSPDDPMAFNVRSSARSGSWGASLQWSGLLSGWGTHRVAVGFAADFAGVHFDQRNTAATIIDGRQIVDAASDGIAVTARTDVRQTAVYALDAWSPGERTTIMISARAQRASLDIRDRSGLSPALNGRHVFDRVNPAIGATYDVHAATTLYANVSHGMRVPTAMELTCADPDAPCSLPNIFVADPPLRPVLATTAEVGARGRLAGSARWSTALYRTRLRDDIQFIATGSAATNAGYFANVGSTERAGAEVNLQFPLGRATLTTRYAYTRAVFLSGFIAHSAANSTADPAGSIAVAPGNHLPGVPAHLLKLRMDLSPAPQWNAGIMLAAASSQYARGNENNADPAGRIGGYAVWNVDVSWRPVPRWQIDIAVSNLLDRRYRTFATLASNVFRGDGGTFAPDLARSETFVGPAPPRAGWITLRHAFPG